MRRALWVVCVCLLSLSSFAQSADQEVVSVVDSVDPVIPGQNLTYTITLRNNGPDPAVNGGLNVNLPGEVSHVSNVVPAGWTCFVLGGNMTCNTPSFTPSTVQIQITVAVASHLLNFPDGSFFGNFFTSGTTIDPNNGNNSQTETTNYDSPQVDLSVLATDSPDPVTPNNDVTFTIDVANAGPDTATNVNFNVVNGSFRFQSATVPAGWNCTLPSVGGSPNFTCTNPSFAPGTSQFQVVMRADPALLGINDVTVPTHFDVNGTGDDTNDNNNDADLTTLYTTDDADVSVTASDSPDPVQAGSNITYTGSVTNAGPQAATNVVLTMNLAPNLLFVSLTGPAGFTCPTPAVGTNGGITCTIATLASGANVPFTLVAQVNPALLSGPDGVIQQNFSISSATNDPTAPNNSVQVFTTYQTPDADITVTNADTPDPVSTGGIITYTQSITNNGPDPAANATFTQSTPAGTTFQSFIPAPGWTCGTPAIGATGNITCSKASMASGESGVFTLIVNVTTSSGPIVSTVTGDSDTYDPDPLDNTATAATSLVPAASADLAITKTTTTTSAAVGSTFSYTITVTNNGPDTAANVVVTDTLPATLLFQSITQPAPFTCTTPAVDATGTITCTAASLASGASRTFTLVVEVAPGATGSIVNSASVDSDTSDPNGGNSGGSAPGVTATPAPSADLGITKTTAATMQPAGTAYTYTITVTNAGPSAATNVVMTDVLPSSLRFLSITQPSPFTCTTPAVDTTGTITCTAATLGAGTTRTFTLVVRIDANASGPIVNGASVDSATADPNGTNDSDDAPTVNAAPSSADLAISKGTNATSAPTGSTITYTIFVFNGGPTPASNAVVTDNLPPSLQFISATPSQGFCNATDPVVCNLGPLNPGANANIVIQALVVATSGTISNTATVDAPQNDPNGGNDSATTPPIPVIAAQAEAIPTLSEWGLIAAALLLGLAALLRMKMS